MVLYLRLMHQNVEIMVIFLILVLRYVHLVRLKLLVLPRLITLKILLVRLILEYMVKVIHSGLLLTLDLVVSKFLEVLQMNRLHQLLILEKVLYSHSLVQQNLHLLVQFLVVSSSLDRKHIHYSVYFIQVLVLSELLELVENLLLQQHILVLVLSENSVVQQNLLPSIHWKDRCSSPLQELVEKYLLQILQKKEQKFVYLESMLFVQQMQNNHSEEYLYLEKVQFQKQKCLLDLVHSRNSLVQQKVLLSTH